MPKVSFSIFIFFPDCRGLFAGLMVFNRKLWCLTPHTTLFQLYRGGHWNFITWDNPQFSVGVLDVRSLVLCVVICRSLFVSLSFFLPVVLSWPYGFRLCPSSFASCIVLTLRILSLSFFFCQLYCLGFTDSVFVLLSPVVLSWLCGFCLVVVLLLPVVLSWLYWFCLCPSSSASCIVLALRILSFSFFSCQLYCLGFTDSVFVLLLSPVVLSWRYGFCLVVVLLLPVALSCFTDSVFVLLLLPVVLSWLYGFCLCSSSFASCIVLALRILSLSFFFRQLHCLGFTDSAFVLLLLPVVLSWTYVFYLCPSSCQLYCLDFTDSVFVLLLLPVALSWLYGFYLCPSAFASSIVLALRILIFKLLLSKR